MIKQRAESVNLYKGNRPELAAAENEEIVSFSNFCRNN